jgi:hypothetical protein
MVGGDGHFQKYDTVVIRILYDAGNRLSEISVRIYETV